MKIRKEILGMLGITRQIEIKRKGEVFTFYQNSWWESEGYIFVDICTGYKQEGQQIFPNGELETTAFFYLSIGRKGGLKTHFAGIKLPLTSSQEEFYDVCSNWLDQYLSEQHNGTLF